MKEVGVRAGPQLVRKPLVATAAGLPLSGRRIVVTRAADQAGPLIAALSALGAEAISLATIAIAPPSDSALLDLALAHLDQYSGFIFTSANAVRAFFGRARTLQLQALRPADSWVCAIGPATATTLDREAGLRWHADIVPVAYRAEGVIEALRGRELRDQRILLPRARVARDLIPVELARRGAMVMTVETYQTVIPGEAQAQAETLFAERGRRVDAVLFTSSSTARNLVEILGPDYRRRLQDVLLAAIGPITRATLLELGLPVRVEAATSGHEGLVAALRSYWQV